MAVLATFCWFCCWLFCKHKLSYQNTDNEYSRSSDERVINTETCSKNRKENVLNIVLVSELQLNPYKNSQSNRYMIPVLTKFNKKKGNIRQLLLRKQLQTTENIVPSEVFQLCCSVNAKVHQRLLRYGTFNKEYSCLIKRKEPQKIIFCR